MAIRSEVEGYDAFCNLIEELQTQDKPVYLYFCGSKKADGKSWCPDCVKASPVVEKAVEEAENIHFVYVGVGDRDVLEPVRCLPVGHAEEQSLYKQSAHCRRT
ncbi:thioredoxin domain-containing protein 17-like isoform X2 [Zootermopsis nevadensis]|uniref:thioredoxin domain-containing protein 17-like isoform X2 n=1 Tax=Zootermopsis nevadensis TaxID=136037 RepID=UPI000B8E64C4|nr:thioredoxin domain-containing protein 17-like isoform X2 [Zootermopsis nevadensis]